MDQKCVNNCKNKDLLFSYRFSILIRLFCSSTDDLRLIWLYLYNP